MVESILRDPAPFRKKKVRAENFEIFSERFLFEKLTKIKTTIGSKCKKLLCFSQKEFLRGRLDNL